jgi:phosphatidylserine decarboxylase
MSRAFGRISDVPVPRVLRRPLFGGFARLVGADLSEAELPVAEYRSLNDFFVRRLRPGARCWPGDPCVAACPVDGVTGMVGVMEESRLLQAKGRWYSAAELLDDAEEAARFAGGVFATLYLSPRHYHRIHSPCEGSIRKARHVPGALLPVHSAAVAHSPDLFATNERLACYLDGPLGRLAVVAVGAYNVGRISARFDPVWNARGEPNPWVTNRPGAVATTRRYEQAIRMRQGEEIMAFHLGSTVVLLFEPGRVVLEPGLVAGAEVRLGASLARAG